MHTAEFLSETRTEIGALLRDVREERGYTSDYVSNHSGCSVFAVHIRITDDVPRNICGVYGKTIGMFVLSGKVAIGLPSCG